MHIYLLHNNPVWFAGYKCFRQILFAVKNKKCKLIAYIEVCFHFIINLLLIYTAYNVEIIMLFIVEHILGHYK